jgi:EAL domain-containing protein (putative c-di-GMP-specific phosphodiesterase class I)
LASSPRGKILLVDDDIFLLKGLERSLVAEGYEVEIARSSPAAVERIARGGLDVVVSDINMPDLDGIQLLEAVRQRDLLLPVVLMTGGPSVETAAKALELGALRYLFKPIKPKDLEDVLEYAIRMHRLALLRERALRITQCVKEVDEPNELEMAFERALSGLWMVYQPIIGWSARRVFAYEALVRTDEPSLSCPSTFFDAAERLDRIYDLGRLIRAEVAEAAKKIPESILLFVNLHPRDLLDEHLYQPEAPLSKIAHRVVLEITERAPLDTISDLRARLQELRDLGFRFALDDLGAGYAGLSGFTVLDPWVVKLDISLVRGVHHDSTKISVIRAMVNLCRELDIVVVSEGIETQEEKNALIDIGCDLLQGFHLAKPSAEFIDPLVSPQT